MPRPVPAPRPPAPAATLAVLGLCALVCLPAPAAGAAAGGTLSFTPARGTATSAITLTTSARCPGGTNVLGRIYGAGFPADGQVAVANTPISALSPVPTGGYRVPLAMPVQDLLNLQRKQVAPTGRYRLVLTCRMPFKPASLGDFTGVLTFDGNHRYTGRAAPAGPGGSSGSGSASGGGQDGAVPPPGGGGTAPGGGTEPTATATATNAPRLAANTTDSRLDLVTAGLVGVAVVGAFASGTVLWRRRRTAVH